MCTIQLYYMCIKVQIILHIYQKWQTVLLYAWPFDAHFREMVPVKDWCVILHMLCDIYEIECPSVVCDFNEMLHIVVLWRGRGRECMVL